AGGAPGAESAGPMVTATANSDVVTTTIARQETRSTCTRRFVAASRRRCKDLEPNFKRSCPCCTLRAVQLGADRAARLQFRTDDCAWCVVVDKGRVEQLDLGVVDEPAVVVH